MDRLKKNLSDATLEANRAAAKAFVKTASQVPHVSGQLRGSFAPLAGTLGTKLGSIIPKQESSFRHRDQNYNTGRSMQSHTITDKTFRYLNEVPYLFNQGPAPEQVYWNDAWIQGGLKAVEAWEKSIFESNLPEKIIDKIGFII